MKQNILAWIVCPICRGDLLARCSQPAGSGSEHEGEIHSGRLVCNQGHSFPIRGGVPLLSRTAELASDSPAPLSEAAIHESFSSEWQHFDYDRSRTWHEELEDRRALFLREVDAEPGELQGKLLLDAGCGNGTLSEAIAQFGCDVLAVDISDSVFDAHRYFLAHGCGRTHFIQADLTDLPIPEQAVDLVYSSGVLHHNPDTRKAFEAISRLVKPGGGMYIWVYHREPGWKFWLQLRLRSILAPLPGPAKRAFVYAWSVQAMVRQHIRTLLRLNDEKDRLTWRERVVDLLDIYTPRYRWMHTQAEVQSWYREAGFAEIKTTEIRKWGFGVLGRKPDPRRGSASPVPHSSEQTISP